MDSPKDSNPQPPSGGSRSFKLPSRAELEERRRVLEENSKPPLLFKPKGIALSQTPNQTRNATNLSSSNEQAALSNESTSMISTSTTPNFVSSRQHFQQQQQQQQQIQKAPAAKPTSISDDEFGFGDLGEVILDDDIFDDDSPPPTSSGAATPSVTFTTTTTTVASSPLDSNSVGSVVLPTFIPKSKSTIVVKASQRGNPLLQSIRNVAYEYGEIVPDYIVGLTSCVLFLSIRYHRLHPEYIFNRIAAIGKNFVLRVLLILVDVDTHQQAIRELTRVALVNDMTVVCAWSNEEAARYIETFKAYENKAPDAIKERVDNDYLSKLTDCLTQVQSINKTDVVTLSSTFGSFKNIMNATTEELGLLPGFGERKVKRLQEAFDQPFAIDPKKRRHRRAA
ncbi:ssDNA endonuclease and repair protein rad10 [Gryganskiella cystojenkinii]|nr:ssDNA endonuclease and repair protein rad10 [Gryganskiella cystojenkinii]